jgi:hypothetical protein
LLTLASGCRAGSMPSSSTRAVLILLWCT